MSILDLEQGRTYSSKRKAAKALAVSQREVERLLAIGWLVLLRLPLL